MVQQAAGAAPGNALAQYNQGVYLINANRGPEAIEAFENALVADPNLIEAHFQLGTLFVGQGKVSEALEHLQTYVDAEPDNEQNVATATGLIAALKK
jgi:tetratricopeptide (TPR) repeat protein